MLEQRFLNFIIEGVSYDNFLVSDVFKNSIIYSSFILQNINSIFKKYNLSYEELFKNKRLVLKENINRVMRVIPAKKYRKTQIMKN